MFCEQVWEEEYNPDSPACLEKNEAFESVNSSAGVREEAGREEGRSLRPSRGYGAEARRHRFNANGNDP